MFRQTFRLFSSKKDKSISLIKREMYADVFQNIIKFGAYYLSHSLAVKAEIMRSLVDAGNHVVLYYANQTANCCEDDNYNFGIP